MSDSGVYAFEGMTETLPYVPLAGRRVLDALGRRLHLEGWLSLDVVDRWTIVRAGAGASVERSVASIIDAATPAPARIDPVTDPDGVSPPADLLAALGAERPLDAARWQGLRPLDRYALAKSAPKPAKLASAYDEIIGATRFSHLTAAGDAHMVDVGGKAATARRAVASACVRTTPRVVEAVIAGSMGKGDVLAVARVAGILASKRTPELIPLCHPVQTTRAAVDFEPDAARGELRVTATVEAVDRTGVEMEAMVAASVASLTVYDMIKSADPWASIEGVRVDAKSGGKSGARTRPAERGGR